MSLRLTTLGLCLLGLAGCATSERANTRVVPRAEESQPLARVSLGRIAVVPFFDDSMLRIQFPLPRGKAVREHSADRVRDFILPPLPPGSIPRVGDIGSAYVVGSGLMVVGLVDMASVALGSVAGLATATPAAFTGIPAAEYYPAFNAVTNTQVQFKITEEVTRRVMAQAQERHALAFVANKSWEAPDTILELYEGERSFKGDSSPNPCMQLRLGFRCTVLRASDRKSIHVFRVAYVSESPTFVQWGAKDARLLSEEVERGLADMAGQIVARLVAMDAPAVTGDQLAKSP